MTEGQITYDTLANSLLNDMIHNLIRNETLFKLSNHLSIEKQTLENTQLKNQPIQTINQFQSSDSTKDIFGQDKVKLKTAENSRYFGCENCGRKIAGGRYAQHINKCLERKRK